MQFQDSHDVSGSIRALAAAFAKVQDKKIPRLPGGFEGVGQQLQAATECSWLSSSEDESDPWELPIGLAPLSWRGRPMNSLP